MKTTLLAAALLASAAIPAWADSNGPEICQNAVASVLSSTQHLPQQRKVETKSANSEECDTYIGYDRSVFPSGREVAPQAFDDYHTKLVKQIIQKLINSGYDPRTLPLNVTVHAYVLLPQTKTGVVAAQLGKTELDKRPLECLLGEAKYNYTTDNLYWNDASRDEQWQCDDL